MSIQVFITGGTIAKRYDEIGGKLVFDANHLTKVLAQGRCTTELKIETLMLKDSLEMDDVDREIIYQSVESCASSKILITHGTDTMVESAKRVSNIHDKTIIFTGAMIPHAFKNSDSTFNVGTALGALSCLEHGVYLAMNGQIFLWDSVDKDIIQGEFVSIS